MGLRGPFGRQNIGSVTLKRDLVKEDDKTLVILVFMQKVGNISNLPSLRIDASQHKCPNPEQSTIAAHEELLESNLATCLLTLSRCGYFGKEGWRI